MQNRAKMKGTQLRIQARNGAKGEWSSSKLFKLLNCHSSYHPTLFPNIQRCSLKYIFKYLFKYLYLNNLFVLFVCLWRDGDQQHYFLVQVKFWVKDFSVTQQHLEWISDTKWEDNIKLMILWNMNIKTWNFGITRSNKLENPDISWK